MSRRGKTSPETLVEPGSVFAGKYRIVRILGQGGMGVVVQATHLELEQPVALKLLRPEVASDPEVVARFSREARAAARIESEHVARVHDVVTTGKQPYLVMEYLDGEDLSRLLERSGPLPVEDAVAYAIQAAEAVAEAHALGIVHRDLKPPNLFLCKRMDRSLMLKVLDFGISKIRANARVHDNFTTNAATAMGSPFYMSPEQMRSDKDIDGRTDIWALGVILHELLTDHGPWRSDVTHQELAAMIFTGDPVPIAELRPGVPLQLEAAIMRCLRKNKRERFANMAELARAIAPFSGGRSAVALARIERLAAQEMGSGPTSLPTESVPLRDETPLRSTRGEWGTTAIPLHKARRRVVAVAGGATIVAACAIGAIAAVFAGSRSTTGSAHGTPGVSHLTDVAPPPSASPPASVPAATTSPVPEIALSSIPPAPSAATRPLPRRPGSPPPTSQPPPPPGPASPPPPAPPPTVAPSPAPVPAPPPTGTSAFGPRK